MIEMKRRFLSELGQLAILTAIASPEYDLRLETG
jgi:hypothetical protein